MIIVYDRTTNQQTTPTGTPLALQGGQHTKHPGPLTARTKGNSYATSNNVVKK